MFRLIHDIYSLGYFIKQTDKYYEYGFRSLRLKLYYNDNGIYKIVSGV
jgi:hypothetical protein